MPDLLPTSESLPHAEVPGKINVCPWWFLPTFDNPLRRLIQNPYRILEGLVRPGQTAVDLGCGMGYFSIPLAQLVGPQGKVICIDLQQQMLHGLRRRAEKAGVLATITLQQCEPTRLGLAEPADFILAFWMLHEVPDQQAFLAEVQAHLKPAGRFLLVEPVGHVRDAAFRRSVEVAEQVGLVSVDRPSVSISRSVLFSKQDRGLSAPPCAANHTPSPISSTSSPAPLPGCRAPR